MAKSGRGRGNSGRVEGAPLKVTSYIFHKN